MIYEIILAIMFGGILAMVHKMPYSYRFKHEIKNINFFVFLTEAFIFINYLKVCLSMIGPMIVILSFLYWIVILEPFCKKYKRLY